MLENTFLRDTSLGVAKSDGRRLEIVATGLPLCQGVPLGIDVTLVSVLRADGVPCPRAAADDGVAIARAERRKAATYPELVASNSLRLVTLACETGGRWSSQCALTLRQLAAARARAAPAALRGAQQAGWMRRWAGLLSIAQQDALAATLVDDVPVDLDGIDGAPPDEVSVWLDGLIR